MDKKRSTISDYPEHLNPFREDEHKKPGRKKRSGSFSNSLKGLTNTLRKSFRSKSKSKKKNPEKEEEVQLRRPVPMLNNRYTLPASYNPSPALPRSRFQERLAKSVTLQRSTNNQYSEENNPFKEEPDGEEQLNERPRRRKKRAPPPPPFQTISEDGEGNRLQVPSYNSNWSLASGETDTTCSVYAPSEYSDEENNKELPEENPEVTQGFQDFTKNMQKLTDDSNNNVIIIVEKSIEPNKEQVSISYIDEDDEDETPKPNEEEVASKEEQEDDKKINEESNQDQKQDEEVDDDSKTPETSFIGNTDDEKCSKLITSTPNHESNGYVQVEQEIVVKTKSLQVNGNGVIANGEEAPPEDASNNNCSLPVPKLRKHKLSKSVLLGKEEDSS